jgi:hypothetical protein
VRRDGQYVSLLPIPHFEPARARAAERHGESTPDTQRAVLDQRDNAPARVHAQLHALDPTS